MRTPLSVSIFSRYHYNTPFKWADQFFASVVVVACEFFVNKCFCVVGDLLHYGIILTANKIFLDEGSYLIMAEKEKTRRTKEEVAEAMKAEDEKKMQEAEEAAKAIAEAEAAIKKLQKTIADNKRKVTNNRNKARTNVGMETYGKVVSALGFFDEEKECRIKSEFTSLQNKMLKRIKDLKEVEKLYKKDHPEYKEPEPEEDKAETSAPEERTPAEDTTKNPETAPEPVQE